MKPLLSKIIAITVFATTIAPSLVLADEYSGGNFIVHDPVIDSAGGYSTDGTIQSIDALSQTAIGESTGGGYTVQSGFVYFGTQQINQNRYRWYSNTDSITPVTALAAENTAITSVADTTVLRLRMTLDAPSEPIAIGSQFKLQYAPQGVAVNCQAAVGFTDIDSIGGVGIWRGYDNATPVDGATLPSSLLTTSGATGSSQTYEEENNSAPTPDFIYVGVNADAEWDWVIQNNGALDSTFYCFRMVYSTGTAFDTYTSVARLGTTGAVIGGGGGGNTYPSNYSFDINNGAVCTGLRDVSVNLIAQGTTAYLISNNQDFIGSDWLSYNTNPTTTPWTLTSGDGLKTVYVMYRSSTGNYSSVLSQNIILDQANNCQEVIPQPEVPPEIIPPGFPEQPGTINRGIIVFTEPNYQGRSQAFIMDDNDLRNDFIGNDTIKSIMVIGDVDIRLFEHINFLGKEMRLHESVPDLSIYGFGSVVSSIKFISGFQDIIEETLKPIVGLFQHINFGGRMEIFNQDDPDLRNNSIGNDIASSLRLVGGAIARLFQHIYYGGIVQLFTGDSASLVGSEIGNDTVSSIQIIKPGALLKAVGDTTVYYYGSDGLLHPFNNPRVYFTWYSDFSQIKSITAKEISQLKVGREIAYRPGIRLVKTVDSPKVYAVDNNRTLRWILDANTAQAIYGPNWESNIQYISNLEFEQYQGGSIIDEVGDFNPIYAAQTRPTPYW